MERERIKHTWLCNANADGSPLKGCAGEGESFLQALNRGKFDVAEALRSVVQLVLDNTDICDFAVGEQFGDVGGTGVERKVSDMGREWRFGWER